MRLVLLPGLNGSSRLFAPLLAQLADLPCQTLELPLQGPQDHASLAVLLAEQLGEGPFVLLGESFSGALAYHLALHHLRGMKGLILAASFLQPPHPLAALASRLPLPKALLSHTLALRLFCANSAPPAVLKLLQTEVRDIPGDLIRQRLQALARLQAPAERLSLPVLHLWPIRDRLVTTAAAAAIARHCSNLRQIRIEGPHFLLQSRPMACAQAIREFLAELRA